MSQYDQVHHFMQECHKITTEAWFSVSSLPNVETGTVEGHVHRLYAIRTILRSFDDPSSTLEEIEDLISYVKSIIHPLENFLDNPPPPAQESLPRVHTGKRGQPAYQIDLGRALLLHDLGNSWQSIAEAFGVRRQTLYEHLDRLGYSSAQKPFTEITDEELDAKINQISLDHPFVGSAIALDESKTASEELMQLEYLFAGLESSSVEFTRSEVQMHYGTTMAMKNYGLGDFGYTGVLMDILG
ncbi:hypothetical protein K435DRAFT_873175 [Dendrothele bispora CBS 962.96]|uniref:Uncharacterized protein n=1 Tax=Dendrothele bispora (strain CBS 962.96) TaxID=1314807 RepID=A0A4S8KZT4_DENBC|nr:hypothetical protein K435DRAFT_873175 [Dendrothele bispora CBS 962.96]